MMSNAVIIFISKIPHKKSFVYVFFSVGIKKLSWLNKITLKQMMASKFGKCGVCLLQQLFLNGFCSSRKLKISTEEKTL